MWNHESLKQFLKISFWDSNFAFQPLDACLQKGWYIKLKRRKEENKKKRKKNGCKSQDFSLFPTNSFEEKDSPCIAMRCFINVPLRTLLPVLITPI